MVPLGFSGHSYSGTKIEGYVPAQDEEVSSERVIVSDDYFETMGIPIVEGRGITRQDRSDALRVSVVNEAFVRRYYAGQEPIGKRIDQGQGWPVIVGVAKDGKYRSLTETPAPLVYSPLQQWYSPAVTLHVRTASPPAALAEAARSEFAAVNVDLPFLDPRTMTEHIAASTFSQLVGASMLSSFAALALVIAAVGLYGVLSYIVNQRTREIAIRLAIGASPKNVIGLVVRRGLTLTGIGVILGWGAGLAAGRLLQSQLLGVTASDPWTLVGAATLLVGVALGACFVPARRASKVDPMVALRYE
jgi:predicted permease